MKKLITLLSFVSMLYFLTQAYAADSPLDAFKEGKPYANIRLRYEHIEQDGLINANSKTARIRLGFKTAKFYDLVGVIEGEGGFYY